MLRNQRVAGRDERKKHEAIEGLTVKSGSRSFDGLRLWWYNCNDDLRKQRVSDVGRGRGREELDGQDGRDGREQEKTDKLGRKLTRTGPGCRPLFVLIWMILVGAPDGPAHHTRIKLAVSALVASNNLLMFFKPATCPFFP